MMVKVKMDVIGKKVFKMMIKMYSQTSNISRAKFQDLNLSRLVL